MTDGFVVDRRYLPSPGSPIAGESTQQRLFETLLAFEAAHKRRSPEGMRACFHDDAVIESVAGDGRPLGPDETVAAIMAAFQDPAYEIGDWSYEEISLDVVLSVTGARHQVASGRMRDQTVFRLMIGREGLMWRVKLFSSRAEALAFAAAGTASEPVGGERPV